MSSSLELYFLLLFCIERQYDEDPVMETDQDRLDDNSEVFNYASASHSLLAL